ncbi:hypothetical protein AGDE_06629 [Angomonas deanei]|nr:hypothetical protein AGDE_06629 [Angomonas deanei]|eukprot:EPY37305.1 hypothetical protein AGDE_06629 [Angomonas deanei]
MSAIVEAIVNVVRSENDLSSVEGEVYTQLEFFKNVGIESAGCNPVFLSCVQKILLSRAAECYDLVFYFGEDTITLSQSPYARSRRSTTLRPFRGLISLEEGLSHTNAETVQHLLQPLMNRMTAGILLEAGRPAVRERKSVFYGLLLPPPHTKNAQKMEQVRQFRLSLPAYERRDEIVSCVQENDVTIICGDTGCGKTTQIPQLLYDSGIFPRNDSIICTQPRRISALSVANRVAAERDEACGDSCGYVIRFENMTSPQTRIIYATTGILLRRLHTEPDLCGVSCVVVDEVHERDVETDFCLLLLRDRLREQREDPSRFATKLKVVVMSATIQIETLERLLSTGCVTVGSGPVTP